MPETTACPICGGPADLGFTASDNLHGLAGPFVVHVCRNCGSGVTLPSVSESELGQFYPRSYYTHAAQPGLSGFMVAFYNWRKALRLGLLRARAGKMLEIGPGDCEFLRFFQRRGWDVSAVDPDPVVVENAKRAGIRMFCGTVPHVPDEKFDVIVAWHSLEHSNDPRRDLSMLLRRLRANGRVIFGVPDFGSRFARFFGAAWHNLDVPRHRVHFTRRALFSMARELGAQVESTKTWLSPRSILESLKTRHGRSLAKFEPWLVLLLTPACWVAEFFGIGDSVSITVTSGNRSAND